MESLSRQKVIDELVNDETDTISQMIFQNDYTYIDSIMRSGVGGIEDLCNEDLIKLYYERFDEEIIIE